MDNTDNIPGEYVMPGVPAVASRAGHDTSRRPRELPNINENESKSMKNNEKQWKSMEIYENHCKTTFVGFGFHFSIEIMNKDREPL